MPQERKQNGRVVRRGDKKQAMKSAAPQASGASKPVDYSLLPQLVGYALRRTQLAVFNHFSRAMDRAGAHHVSPSEFGVLALIEANRGINQTTLANAVGADRSTMVPILDRLERRGMIERQPVPGDRRAYALTLGEAGRKRMSELRRIVQAHEARIAAEMTAAERQVLLDLLHRLRKAAETA